MHVNTSNISCCQRQPANDFLFIAQAELLSDIPSQLHLLQPHTHHSIPSFADGMT